ncbi:hypothetical protein JCGZ_24404 [Jatropha curcas]|uniref:Uncharacterized protein n=1 Tax=Jatropha curcas TaxID=180498 RepID=A0A067LDR1_JATCU|nr:hypothetical protein JCGZ_24404 [Jatropha curcas]
MDQALLSDQYCRHQILLHVRLGLHLLLSEEYCRHHILLLLPLLAPFLDHYRLHQLHSHLLCKTDESEAESRIDEVALYLEAVGGEKKRKVYGIGSQASQFYCGSAAHASTASAGPQPEHTDEQYTKLRARVDDQQRQITELRAQVMRLSGESGAGTSSSDPALATDRNVSTSQQQPLPAPDPDAAYDTLVTPPGTTAHPAHPAGTPPGDSTSDRADEQ